MSEFCLTLRVQVPNNHILTLNRTTRTSTKISPCTIIEYMDPLGLQMFSGGHATRPESILTIWSLVETLGSLSVRIRVPPHAEASDRRKNILILCGTCSPVISAFATQVQAPKPPNVIIYNLVSSTSCNWVASILNNRGRRKQCLCPCLY